MKKLLVASLVLLSGCATAGTLKRQIGEDLEMIVESQDCEITCAALKEYIKTKLPYK